MSLERRAQMFKKRDPPPKGSFQKSRFEKNTKQFKKKKTMRKPGQRSSGGKAPKKQFYWPPRAVTRELEDVNNRSMNTQTENSTSAAKTQTYASTSDQQNQTGPTTRDHGTQAEWQYEIIQPGPNCRFKLCYRDNCECQCGNGMNN